MTEAVFPALESAKAALGLAPFALDDLLIFLPHHPGALPTGGDPDLLDSRSLQLGGSSRQARPAIVDRHLRGRLLAEDLAIILQTLLRHLVLVGSWGDAASEQIATLEPVDQPLHPEFHSPLAFDDSARLGEAGVEDLLRGHFARLQPVLDLRQQLPRDFPHALQGGRGLLFDTPAARAPLLDDCLGRCDQLLALLEELLENLLLFRFRFGEQMMVLDAVINLLRLLDSRLRRLYAAPSELPQGPLDPLGYAFQDPRLVRIPDRWFLHRRIRGKKLAVGKAHCRRSADE